MSHAEKDDMISMRRVKVKRASIHDIEDSEEKTLKQ